MLLVTADYVHLQDVESTQSCYVNGKRVRGAVRLAHLDTILVGNTELLLIEDEGTAENAYACKACGHEVSPREIACPKCGTALPFTRSSWTTQPSEVSEDDTGVRQNALKRVLGLAESSLSLQRFDAAERLLEEHLSQLLDDVKAGETISDRLLNSVASCAVRLAQGLRSKKWLDWCFEIHQAAAKVIEQRTSEKLSEAILALNYTDCARIRAYLAVWSQSEESLTFEERFVLRRLRSLERRVAPERPQAKLSV